MENNGKAYKGYESPVMEIMEMKVEQIILQGSVFDLNGSGNPFGNGLNLYTWRNIIDSIFKN